MCLLRELVIRVVSNLSIYLFDNHSSMVALGRWVLWRAHQIVSSTRGHPCSLAAYDHGALSLAQLAVARFALPQNSNVELLITTSARGVSNNYSGPRKVL